MRLYTALQLSAPDSREITGTAVRYGEVTPGRQYMGLRVQIEPGAFGNVSGADVILNVQHDRTKPLARTGGGGLSLLDSPEALLVRAILPRTRRGNDTLALVRSKVLRGLSVEANPTSKRIDGETLIVEAADLTGLGIVDRPAFPASEINAAQDRAISGKVNLGQPLACRCRKNCDRIIIEPDAFDRALAEAAGGSREITAALTGNFDKPIASLSAGTMKIRRRENVLHIDISRLTDTQPVRDWLASLGAARYYARPYFPDDQSTFTVEGTTARFTEADLRTIEIAPMLGPTEGLVEIAVTGGTIRQAQQRPRLRVWL